MVQLSNHGGGCCGAVHLHGFYGDEDMFPNEINQALREDTDHNSPLNFARRQNKKSIEVILNRNQCITKPRVIKRLAELGFVLTSSWVNANHNSRLFRFERCGTRRPITPDTLPFNWPANQIINAEMEGHLPAIPETGGHYDLAEGENLVVEQEAFEPILAKTLFYNRYRNNAISGGYLTREEALSKNRSRDPRLDKLEIFVNGDGTVSERWTENV